MMHCRRVLRRNIKRTLGREIHPDPITTDLDLQKLIDVATGNPRLLWTPYWQTRLHSATRRITEENGFVPWYLLFIYHRMETVVDALSYDELCELFSDHPMSPTNMGNRSSNALKRVNSSLYDVAVEPQ